MIYDIPPSPAPPSPPSPPLIMHGEKCFFFNSPQFEPYSPASALPLPHLSALFILLFLLPR